MNIHKVTEKTGEKLTVKEQKHTLGTWFRSLRRTSQVAIVMILIAAVGVVAYAASVLFNTAHSTYISV